MKYFKLLSFNLIILILLTVSVEISAGLGRIFIGKDFMFHLFEKDIFKFKRDGNENCWRMKTDVILSHTHFTKNNCLPKGGKTFADEYVYYDVSDIKNKKILTLGGSTTSGFYYENSNGDTYPKILAELVKEEFFVLNGGVEGYSSLQELYKLVKDGPRIKNLDIVISLNGINELPDYQGSDYLRSKYYPFLTSVQSEMNNRQIWINQKPSILFRFFPNVSSFIKYLALRKSSALIDNNDNKEIFKSIDPVSRWETNIKRMNSISNALNIRYYIFLQPTMGLRGPQSNPKKGSLDEKIYLKINSVYINKINDLYEGLKQKCALLSYCFDISDKIPPTGNVYHDARHYNANGNEILAKIIWDTIKKR